MPRTTTDEELDDAVLDAILREFEPPRRPRAVTAAATPRPATQAAPPKPPTPAAPPVPPPAPSYSPPPLVGSGPELADVIFEDILAAYRRSGKLTPGGTDELRRQRSRRIELWPRNPGDTAAQVVGMLEGPDCDIRDGAGGSPDAADLAAMFLPRVRPRRREAFLAAAAELAGPSVAATAARIASAIVEGGFDEYLNVKAALPASAQAVRGVLNDFKDALAPDVDLHDLAREWEELGHGGRESIARSIAARLAMPHWAARVAKGGRPVAFGPHDPRVPRSDQSGPSAWVNNPARGAM